ncbi:Uncharacterised protein [Vibrio cholerae]|nr:Uncharacterised protein [Vibrio cholerae]CSC41098.1 Uncharacterised protein [Vibrio cholerae]CSC72118.1 Uncharacterised protein [Vibrio cholerae]CSI58305.1 Uncharacterised protein [Vibrio cholerae]
MTNRWAAERLQDLRGNSRRSRAHQNPMRGNKTANCHNDSLLWRPEPLA